jgi:hypothetical protein
MTFISRTDNLIPILLANVDQLNQILHDLGIPSEDTLRRVGSPRVRLPPKVAVALSRICFMLKLLANRRNTTFVRCRAVLAIVPACEPARARSALQDAQL